MGGPGHNTHDDIKREELGLFRIRSYVWRDVVFVNVSGDAEEFTDYAADLIERWKEFDQPLRPGGTASSFKLDVNCNWKLAVENFLRKLSSALGSPRLELLFPAGGPLPHRKTTGLFWTGHVGLSSAAG